MPDREENGCIPAGEETHTVSSQEWPGFSSLREPFHCGDEKPGSDESNEREESAESVCFRPKCLLHFL